MLCVNVDRIMRRSDESGLYTHDLFGSQTNVEADFVLQTYQLSISEDAVQPLNVNFNTSMGTSRCELII